MLCCRERLSRIGRRGATLWMLEMHGMQVLRGDPRWQASQQRLRDRIARDGEAAIAPPSAQR